MSRANQVKNRAPAPIQISAEQILREAADRQEQHVVDPVVKIHDAEEYQSHLQDRRKHFEDNIRYRREHIGNWVKYARFEEENSEFERARSIFERALEVEHRSGELWLRYADFEMRNEFLNRARNVLDRAVQILPRVDFLWYKYVYMEEMVGDIPKTRAVFERWMKWMPDDNAWLAFARFETKYNSQKAEAVMRSYVNAYPGVPSFCRFAKWAEFEAKDVALARTVFESALEELEPEESKQARLFKQFASFEERQGEYERARVIYQHAISLLQLEGEQHQGRGHGDDDDDNNLLEPAERKKRKELYQSYMTFEKKHGNRRGIEQVVFNKQRAQYKKRCEADPTDYDGWLEWAKMEQENLQSFLQTTESQNNNSTATNDGVERVREIYERAVANVPPTTTGKDQDNPKDAWRRYIYVWINYAVYEEMENHDLDRASEVYQACLKLIPHKSFTFGKLWILAAKCHVRRHDLPAARALLGKAIGLSGYSSNPTKQRKIFEEYIALELALGEVDRCRTLYNNYIKAMPHYGPAWMQYAGMEQSVGETERCRAIYQLGIEQEVLDMPEMTWKAYIDFEISEGEFDKARALYEKLLERTSHVKVWISLAQFEATKNMEQARKVLTKAYEKLKEAKKSEERVLLLDAWRVLEKTHGDVNSLSAVENKMPRRLKRKRMRKDENGNALGWEEFFDYQFPDDVDDSGPAGNLKILEMAAQWKKQKHMEESDESSDEDD